MRVRVRMSLNENKKACLETDSVETTATDDFGHRYSLCLSIALLHQASQLLVRKPLLKSKASLQKKRTNRSVLLVEFLLLQQQQITFSCHFDSSMPLCVCMCLFHVELLQFQYIQLTNTTA